MFNTAMIYELGVIKTQAEPLLELVPENCEQYSEAYRLHKFLKYSRRYNSGPSANVIVARVSGRQLVQVLMVGRGFAGMRGFSPHPLCGWCEPSAGDNMLLNIIATPTKTRLSLQIILLRSRINVSGAVLYIAGYQRLRVFG